METRVWRAILAAKTVISYLTAPKPEQPKPAGYEDLDVPNSEEGRAAKVVFGTVLYKDASVVRDGDFSTSAVKASGGKK